MPYKVRNFENGPRLIDEISYFSRQIYGELTFKLRHYPIKFLMSNTDISSILINVEAI